MWLTESAANLKANVSCPWHTCAAIELAEAWSHVGYTLNCPLCDVGDARLLQLENVAFLMIFTCSISIFLSVFLSFVILSYAFLARMSDANDSTSVLEHHVLRWRYCLPWLSPISAAGYIK
jgi:heme/copper-type cytochrome/quinol oxidase subunit 2